MQESNKPRQASFLKNLWPGPTWSWGHLDPELPPVLRRGNGCRGGGGLEGSGHGIPPLHPPPPPPTPAFLGCKGEKKRFLPSPLLKPSNTPPKVGGLPLYNSSFHSLFHHPNITQRTVLCRVWILGSGSRAPTGCRAMV